MLKCKEKAGCMLKNKETTVTTNDTTGVQPPSFRAATQEWNDAMYGHKMGVSTFKCKDTRWV